MLKFINDESLAVNFESDIPEWFIQCINEINSYYKLNNNQANWYFWNENQPEVIEEYFRSKNIELERFNIETNDNNRTYRQSIGRGFVFKSSPELTNLIISKTS